METGLIDATKSTQLTLMKNF